MAKSSFDRFESSDLTDLTKRGAARLVEDVQTVRGPRAVRLVKGTVPFHEEGGLLGSLARRTFLPIVKSRYRDSDFSALEQRLASAHIRVRPMDFMAMQFAATALLGAVALAAGIAVLSLGAGLGFLPVVYSLPLALAIIILVPLLTFIVYGTGPKRRAKGRGKDIDKRLSYAMSFVSTLSSANVNVDVIFRELARQPIYGEVAKEAQWIVRDIELVGKDALTAIRDGSARTPSVRFQDILQGVVTTTLSGGQLKPYFVLKAEQLNKTHKLDTKRNLESLGLLAETFVTVVVAMPLFLIVMMSLLTIGAREHGQIENTLFFLYLIVFAVIPMSQVGFIVVFSVFSEDS